MATELEAHHQQPLPPPPARAPPAVPPRRPRPVHGVLPRRAAAPLRGRRPGPRRLRRLWLLVPPRAGLRLDGPRRRRRSLPRRLHAGNGVAFTTVVVCDPLYRRYVLLPPIPQDLAAAVQQRHLANAERRCEVFLAPCSEGEEAAAVAAESTEPFRVMWMAQCPTKLVAFVFSSASEQWQAVASPSWRELNPEMPAMTDMRSLFWRNYAYGCFYWLLSNFPNDRKLLVLNTSTMEFTPGKAPSVFCEEGFAMVELGESKLGMFVLEGSVLNYFRGKRQNEGSTYEWEWRKGIGMPRSCKHDMLGAFDGKIFLQARADAGSTRESGCFWVDFETKIRHNVRGVLGKEFRPLSALYTGYPPSLSPPAE